MNLRVNFNLDWGLSYLLLGQGLGINNHSINQILNIKINFQLQIVI
jgi:hypothetical protein